MKKRMLAIFVLLVLLAGALLPAVRAAELDLPAPSYVLMERSTGEVLLEHNAHERLRPASVTKVMTLLLIMEALDDGRIGWDDMVQTSAAAAAKGGSQIYLEENEQLPLEEMLKSIVVSSANDCACAMAEHIAGSEAAFVEMMNARAEQLGMTDTHFVNCTGLDDEPEAAEHLTTAYDIALMSRELLGHEAIKKYTTIWMDTVRVGQFGLSNPNKRVRFYDGTPGADRRRAALRQLDRPVRISQGPAELRLFQLCARHAGAGRAARRAGHAGYRGGDHARSRRRDAHSH